MDSARHGTVVLLTSSTAATLLCATATEDITRTGALQMLYSVMVQHMSCLRIVHDQHQSQGGRPPKYSSRPLILHCLPLTMPSQHPRCYLSLSPCLSRHPPLVRCAARVQEMSAAKQATLQAILGLTDEEVEDGRNTAAAAASSEQAEEETSFF